MAIVIRPRAITIFATKEAQLEESNYLVYDADSLYKKSEIAFLIEDGLVKQRGDV